MRTQYELKKKERSSALANMSLEQHAFSFNQKNQFKIPELPSASGNIREKMDSMKDTSSLSPVKSLQTPLQSPGAGSSRDKQQVTCYDNKQTEQQTGTTDVEDDTESCYQTTIQESTRKRKWYSFF